MCGILKGSLTPFKISVIQGLRSQVGDPTCKEKGGLAGNKKKIHYTLNAASKWIHSVNNGVEMKTHAEEKNEDRTR